MSGQETTLTHFHLNPLCAIGARHLPESLQAFIVTDTPDAKNCVRDRDLLISEFPLNDEHQVAQALFYTTARKIRENAYEFGKQYAAYGLDESDCRNLLDSCIRADGEEGLIYLNDMKMENWGNLFQALHGVVLESGIHADLKDITIPYSPQSEAIEIPKPDLFRETVRDDVIPVRDFEENGYRFDISNRDLLANMGEANPYDIGNDRIYKAVVKSLIPQISEQFKQKLLANGGYVVTDNVVRKLEQSDLDTLNLGFKDDAANLVVNHYLATDTQRLEYHMFQSINEHNHVYEQEGDALYVKEAWDFHRQHPLLSIGFERLPYVCWQIYQFFDGDISDDDVLANMETLSEAEIPRSLFYLTIDKVEKYLLEHESDYPLDADADYQDFVNDNLIKPLYFNYADSHVYIGDNSVDNLYDLLKSFHQEAIEAFGLPEMESPFADDDKLRAEDLIEGYYQYDTYPLFDNLAAWAIDRHGLDSYAKVVSDIDNDAVLDDLRLVAEPDMLHLSSSCMSWIAQEIADYLNSELKEHPRLEALADRNDNVSDTLVYDWIEQLTDSDYFTAVEQSDVSSPVGSLSGIPLDSLMDKMVDFITEKAEERIRQLQMAQKAPTLMKP